ncbi:hypothetical protein VTH06DRAFT_1433 [Thermothelomyces fergusii]
MPDLKSSPLRAAAGSSSRTPKFGERDEVLESTPLLSSPTTRRYNGERDDAHHGDTMSIASRNTRTASVKSAREKSIRWPSVISMIVLASLSLAIMIFAFIVPAALQEYAKEAVVIEPTNLSVDSITLKGIRTRIQVNFRVDAHRVSNEHVRRIGKVVTWVVRELETESTEIQLSLPDHGNALLGTAGFPPLKVIVADGHNNEVDFVADISPGDAHAFWTIAMEWMKGRLSNLRIQGQADVQIRTGAIPLGTHSIVESLTFEGSKLPHMPEYNITRMKFKEQPIPGARNAMAAEVTVQSFNPYPFSFDVPELGFDVLVPGCSPEDPSILAAAATTSPVAVRPNADVVVNAQGLVRELPDSLTQLCPDSDYSPLDLLLKKYLDGEVATVLVRGQKQPAGDAPDWLTGILSGITVPVPFPGRSFDNLVRSFSLTDVYFKMPDPTAGPNDPASNPRVSGTVLVVAGLPSEVEFSLSVTAIQADADVFYKGDKLGEISLDKWQKAKSTQIPATEDDEATLEIQSRVRNVPLHVTDPDVLTDVIQALMFGGREVMLSVKTLVDVKVQTVLGELIVKDIPAEGKIPVKRPSPF